MTDSGLTWAGALFMLVSWGAILAVLVYCFSKLLNNKRRR